MTENFSFSMTEKDIEKLDVVKEKDMATSRSEMLRRLIDRAYIKAIENV